MRRRALPTTGALDLDTPEGVQRALDALVESGVVTAFAEGLEAVYAIGPDQHLTAAYYRNTIIHFFVNGAIAELALLRAAEVEASADAPGEFWDEALRLRDLLKFEFFFADKEAFRDELRDEVALHDPDWETRLARGRRGDPRAACAASSRSAPTACCGRSSRPTASSATRSSATTPATPVDESALPRHAASRSASSTGCSAASGSTESVSKVLFATALRLARNRELLDPTRRISSSAAAPSPPRSARSSAASTPSTRSPPAAGQG